MRTEGIPHSAATVVVVALDGDSMGVVRETLAAEAVLPNNSLDFEEAPDSVARTLPDVVLVGMDQNKEAAMEFARIAAKEAPRSTLVAISSVRDANLILSAMRVGFKEFIVLPEDADQLREVVHGAAFAPDDDGEKGLVVVIAGAKGGVGSTLIATHLAAELAAIHRVICIDLDFSMGDIAPQMDIIPKDTIADVLPRADNIDERMLTGAVFVHPSKVHFLCMPDDLDRVGDVQSDAIFNIVNTASKGYQYVIVDVGSNLDEAAVVAFNIADQIVLITTPDVVAVRDCHRRLKVLNTLGVEKKRIAVVLNKVPKQPYLTQDTIEQNLQIRIMGRVSEDSRTVDQAINEGKLIRDVNRKAEIATELAQLVGILNEDPDDVAPAREEEKTGFFAKLFSR